MRDELKQPERTGFDEWALFGWHEGGRFNDPFIYQNGKLRNDTSGQFGPDLYVEFLVDFMERNKEEGKPFFAYYSMALCHDVTDDLKDRHVAFFKDGRWMNYAEMAAAMDRYGRTTHLSPRAPGHSGRTHSLFSQPTMERPERAT